MCGSNAYNPSTVCWDGIALETADHEGSLASQPGRNGEPRASNERPNLKRKEGK